MEYAIRVGQQASMRKTITETDVVLFGCVTGDQNSLHTDEITASESRFGRRIAHGMLAAGLISAVLGMRLPGPGTIYLKQTLSFRKPIYINDTVTTTVTVASIREDKLIVTLSTTVTNQDDEVCVEGESLVFCDRCRIVGPELQAKLGAGQTSSA